MSTFLNNLLYIDQIVKQSIKQMEQDLSLLHLII